jgi:general secretion pathway protein I
MIARRVQRGFSLLEVLVAFAVLAITLGVLLQVFSGAIGATHLSAGYSRAAALAESKLNGVGIEIPLEIGTYEGDPEGDLSWFVVIEPYDAELSLLAEPAYPAYVVTAVAGWGEGERVRRVSLTTLRLGESE